MNKSGTQFPKEHPPENSLEISNNLIDSIFHYIDFEPELFKNEILFSVVNNRIMLNFCNSVNQYLEVLMDSSIEKKELESALVFKAPSVFENSAIYKSLKKKVIKNLQIPHNGDGLKVWIPFCGSGYTVVSVAAFLEENNKPPNKTYKIYATDVNMEAIKQASKRYIPLEDQSKIPKGYLKKYFTSTADGWVLREELGRKIIYTKIDFLRSKIIQNMDLIAVTPSFEYLKPEYKEKILEIFNSSLAPGGFVLFTYPFSKEIHGIKQLKKQKGLYRKNGLKLREGLKNKFFTRKESVIDLKKSILEKLVAGDLEVLIDGKLHIKHLPHPIKKLLKLKDQASLNKILDAESGEIVSKTIQDCLLGNKVSVFQVRLLKYDQKIHCSITPVCKGDLFLLQFFCSTPENRLIENTKKINGGDNTSQGLEKVSPSSNPVYNNQTTKELLDNEMYLLTNSYKNKITRLEQEKHEIEKIIYNLDVAYLLLDSELRIIKVNKKAKKFFNLNQSDLYQRVYKVIPQFDNRSTIQELIAVIREDKTVETEKTLFDNKLLRFNFSPYKPQGNTNKFLNIVCYSGEATTNNFTADKKYHTLLTFINNTGNILYARNLEKHMRFNYVSENVKKLTGYSPFQFTKDPHFWLNLLHPDDIDHVRKCFDMLSIYGHFEIEYRLVFPSNEYVWIKDEMRVITSENEKMIVGTWIDITARKTIDIAYREAERRFKNLFENTHDLIVSINARGGLEFANKSWGQFLKYDGFNLEKLGIKDVVEKMHFSEFEKKCKQAFRGKETSKFKTSFLSSDGAKIPVEGIILPYFIGNNVVSVHGIFKKTAVDLYENTPVEEFENILNGSQDLIVAIGNNYKHLIFNKGYCEFFIQNFKKVPKIGDYCFNFLPEYSSQNNKFKREWRKALEGEKFEFIDEFIENGDKKFFDRRFSPIKNRSGNIMGAIQTLREITAQVHSELTQHQALVNLQESNKELEHFIYIISHDLRGPIINLKGLLEIFQRKNLLNDQNEDIFRRMASSTDQVHETLNDLIELISLGNPKNKLTEYIEFDTVLEKIEKILATQISETNTKIIKDFTKVSGIHYHRGQLKSIFLNILSNAIKYRHPEREPVIEVNSFMEKDYVVIFMKDNGMGFDETKKDKVFGMFQRLSEDQDGKGIGLYITKSQIESLGGKIDVTSKKGRGSTFKLYLKNQLRENSKDQKKLD